MCYNFEYRSSIKEGVSSYDISIIIADNVIRGDKMNYYSIGESAIKLNITTQTLRNWEKED
jgi:hypothetical protein